MPTDDAIRLLRLWPRHRACGSGAAQAASDLVAPAESAFLDAKTEAELEQAEAAELLAELGLGEPDLAQLARAGCRGPETVNVPDGGSEGSAGLDHPGRRHRARGRRVIHADVQRGLIKAEIVSFDDLMAAARLQPPGLLARPGSGARITSCATAT
jgi:ribosome-binding ATPase